MRKPKVTVNCVANAHSAPNERIVEFSDPLGNGGLISLRYMPDGTLLVDVYRVSDNVRVIVPEGKGYETPT